MMRDLVTRPDLHLWDVEALCFLFPGCSLDVEEIPIPGTLEARDANDVGQVVGTMRNATGQLRAYLWTEFDGLTQLPTLGGSAAQAHAINDAGTIAGIHLRGGQNVAIIWTETEGIVSLGTLGGSFSQAFDGNNRGDVVGVSGFSTGSPRAFLWRPAMGMASLGAGVALGVNRVGPTELIAGTSGGQGVVWKVGVMP